MATRRTHSLEFKQSAVDASEQIGASIAGVAMAHGINANQLHKWRRTLVGPGAGQPGSASSSLIPVMVTPDARMKSPTDDPSSGRIDIELGRARVSLYGQVDLDVLHTVLSMLRSR